MDNLLAPDQKRQHDKRFSVEPVLGANLLRQALQAHHSTITVTVRSIEPSYGQFAGLLADPVTARSAN
jgi:hypothetical protein